MGKRTKTPVQIHEQFCRVFDYISNKDWANGKPTAETQEKHGEFLDKLHETAWTYIKNIYKLAGVPDFYDCPAQRANIIWVDMRATKEQYTKG